MPPGGYGSDEYLSLVPYGSLPAIDHDGFVLADSEAINEYLEELVPSPALWPAAIEDRARARELSRFHDTRLEPAVRALFSHVNPQQRDQAFVDQQCPVIAMRLEQLARLADPRPLLTGNDISLCDCGYAITLEMLDQIDAAMRLQISLPEPIARYVASLRDHPVVKEELSTYRPALAAWIASETGN